MPIKKVGEMPGWCCEDHSPSELDKLTLEPGFYEHTCPKCGEVTSFAKYDQKTLPTPGIPWTPNTPYNPYPWNPVVPYVPSYPYNPPRGAEIWCGGCYSPSTTSMFRG